MVARGGFSGLFPESSEFANNMAFQTTETLGVDVALLCSKLQHVLCVVCYAVNQNVLSRTTFFDGQPMPTVEDVTAIKPKLFWLSVPVSCFSESRCAQIFLRLKETNLRCAPHCSMMHSIHRIVSVCQRIWTRRWEL